MCSCRTRSPGCEPHLLQSANTTIITCCIDRNEINIKLEELKKTERVLDVKAKQLFEVQ